MSAILEKKLDFYIKNNLNVLFRGRHGIGKSSLILDAFKRNGIKFKYFSAATMDPWVDFVGVPKEKVGEDGLSYIQLLKPKDITDGSIEAFFFDEFNRAPKKVRNAVMEILQFKSINGEKLPNLRFIWGAINPKEDDNLKFDVEDLDPAQEDRFEIHIDLPYALDSSYMSKKFGDDVASIASEWWSKLPPEILPLVSPRRLDYALGLYKIGGDIRDVLPLKSNPSKLFSALKTAPVAAKLRELINSKNETAAKEFLVDDNSYFASIGIIKEKKDYTQFFLPLVPKEKLSSLILTDKDIQASVFANASKFKDVLIEIYNSTNNNGLKYSIGTFFPELAPPDTTTSAPKTTHISGLFADPATWVGTPTSISIGSTTAKGTPHVSTYVAAPAPAVKRSFSNIYKAKPSIEEEDRALYRIQRNFSSARFRSPYHKPAGTKRSYIREVNLNLNNLLNKKENKEFVAQVLVNLCYIVEASQVGTLISPTREEQDIGLAISRCLVILNKTTTEFFDRLKSETTDALLVKTYNKLKANPTLSSSIDLGRIKVES